MKKLFHLTLCASLVTVLCISLASCDRFNTWLDNPVTIYINLGGENGEGNGTGEGAGEGEPSTTLTPEQIAETKAVLTEAQKEGSKISIEFTYKGIDYAAGFEKQNDLDYKLVMFTSNKTSTLDETLALAKFTPYLITRFPDSWTDQEAEDYLKALGISDGDDEGDDEGDDDGGADSGDDDDDEGVEVNDDEADAVEGEEVPDDGSGSGDDDDDDKTVYTDELVVNLDDGDGSPAPARQRTRAAGEPAVLDMLFGLTTADDEDLVQVQVSTDVASATIVGDTDNFTLKSLATNTTANALARTRAEEYKPSLTVEITRKGAKKLKKVTLSPGKSTICINEIGKLTASVSPEDAKVKKIHWLSKGKVIGFAKVENSQLAVKVKGLKVKKKATIKAKIDKKKRNGKVTVLAARKLKLSQPSLSLKPGEKSQLTATMTPKGAPNKKVTWTTSNKKVAKVTSDGKVTAVGAGEATITVRSQANTKVKAICKVTVTRNTMTVSADGFTGPYDKQPHGITVNVTEPATGAKIKYCETKDGTYSETCPTYTDVGTYTTYYKISCTGYTTVTGSAEVKITQAAGSISFKESKVTMKYGETVPANPLTKTGDGTVSYSSTNTSVATVDKDGKVTVVGTGETTIKATVANAKNYAYATAEASYTLTVNAAVPQSGLEDYNKKDPITW